MILHLFDKSNLRLFGATFLMIACSWNCLCSQSNQDTFQRVSLYKVYLIYTEIEVFDELYFVKINDSLVQIAGFDFIFGCDTSTQINFRSIAKLGKKINLLADKKMKQIDAIRLDERRVCCILRFGFRADFRSVDCLFEEKTEFYFFDADYDGISGEELSASDLVRILRLILG